MPVSTRHNQISALLVALVYIFFSTFGAVAHTHAPMAAGRNTAASIGGVAVHAPPGPRCIAPAHSGCAACEWQALSVTQTRAPQALLSAELLRMVPALRTVSYITVSLACFASRAPPTA